MNIKLKLFLFSILISVSSLSFAVDTDGDGVDDSIDNCPFIANSDQANFDEDSFGDNCDFDDDNDRVVDQKDPDPHNPMIIHSSSVYESEYNDEREFSTLFNYIAEGYLSDINDVDWFKVDVNESGTTGSFSVAFDTRLISQSNKFFDVDWFGPDMSIRSGRNISSDDNLFLYTFPAFETGSYFVRVQYSMGASYFYSGGRYRIIAKAESFVTTAEICDGMDINNDGVFDSDVCDSDGDSIADVVDAYPFNSLYSADSDSDGMPDAWETRYGLDPNDASDATSDQDNDGVSALDGFLAGTIPSGSLDIDGNEEFDALTDGLLILRSMFGLTDSPLITGAVADDALYVDAEEIQSRIEGLGNRLDIDNDGNIDALTDGLVTLRYLFGLTGEPLISGVIATGADRITAEDIEAYMAVLTSLDTEPPVFTSQETFTAPENQTAIGTVTATDANSLSITFSISGSELSITSAGVLTFASAPDYETKSSYTATVTATDGTNSTDQSVTVTVTDVDDEAPVFTSSATFSAAENQTAIGTVTVSDQDGDDITFSISGSELNITSEGVLSFVVAPDYETRTLFQETVTVSDGNNSIEQVVTVQVLNENDNPPILEEKIFRFTAEEDETSISGTLSVSDLDGDNLNYSITGSDIVIDNQGYLSFTSPPNYNQNRFFSETITVYDGVYSDSIKIYVSILASYSQRGNEIDTSAVSNVGGFYRVAEKNPLRELIVMQNDIFQYEDQDWVEIFDSDIDSGFKLSASNNDGTYQLISNYSNENRVIRLINGTWNQVGNLPYFSVAEQYGNNIRRGNISDDGLTVSGTDRNSCVAYKYISSSWVLTGTLDSYSYSSCQLSGDGNSILLRSDNSDILEVYIYESSSWVKKGSTITANGQRNNTFGSFASVDISYDGSAIGFAADSFDTSDVCDLPEASGSGGSQSEGRIIIYKFTNSDWNFHGEPIIGFDGQCLLGSNWDLGEDGNTLALTAYSGASGQGIYAYIYKYFDSQWLQLSKKITRVHSVNNGGGSSLVKNPIMLGNNSGSFATIKTANGYETSHPGKVNVYDLNTGEAPIFTSNSIFNVDENKLAIGTVTATDSDSSNITFSISGSDISIDSSTGAITLITAGDYETKTSYSATLRATDGVNISAQDITVTVTDIDD